MIMSAGALLSKNPKPIGRDRYWDERKHLPLRTYQRIVDAIQIARASDEGGDARLRAMLVDEIELDRYELSKVRITTSHFARAFHQGVRTRHCLHRSRARALHNNAARANPVARQ